MTVLNKIMVLGVTMLRILATAFPLLYVSLAHAIDQTEEPIETNTTGILIFAAIFVLCIALFVWYMWKAAKKPEDEKLGDKF